MYVLKLKSLEWRMIDKDKYSYCYSGHDMRYMIFDCEMMDYYAYLPTSGKLGCWRGKNDENNQFLSPLVMIDI